MFTLAELALWDADETFQQLTAALPLGWKISAWEDSGYLVAELHDDKGESCWCKASPDAKLLFLDGLGWLMTRNHKTTNPVWRPRARERELRVPNPISDVPDPPDLDPVEVAAVYRARR